MNVVLPVLHVGSTTEVDVAVLAIVCVLPPTDSSYRMFPCVFAELHGHPQLVAFIHVNVMFGCVVADV